MPLKNKCLLESSLSSLKQSFFLQRQNFGDNKCFFKEQACKTSCRNKVHIKDQTNLFFKVKQPLLFPVDLPLSKASSLRST